MNNFHTKNLLEENNKKMLFKIIFDMIVIKSENSYFSVNISQKSAKISKLLLTVIAFECKVRYI